MKTVVSFVILALALSGCSETWKGVKKDSSEIWTDTKQTTNDVVQGTKEAIHKATE